MLPLYLLVVVDPRRPDVFRRKKEMKNHFVFLSYYVCIDLKLFFFIYKKNKKRLYKKKEGCIQSCVFFIILNSGSWRRSHNRSGHTFKHTILLILKKELQRKLFRILIPMCPKFTWCFIYFLTLDFKCN